MSADELVRERHGHALLLRLNRPDARNALTAGIITGLADAIVEVEGDPDIRVVVLTGTGDRAFCAGMDLKALARTGPVASREATAVLMRLMDGDVGVPVVGAANATAFGGGLELLLGCDVIVASSEAMFGLPEVKRGLFPGGSGTAIGQRVPLGLALELTLTGDPITATRAYEIGLVNAVVPPDEVVPAALAMAERIGANAPLGLAAVKELVRLHATDPARAAERLGHWRGVVFGSADAKEGATAFVEKRPPVWQGR
ncbi:MAG: caiD 6 [Actinomycetia bacterium]|nr:caiD 6 [Actinomycetes bacterium]